MRNPHKWTTESFSARIGEISPTIQVRGVYTKLADPIECKCLTCNTIWYPNSGNLLRGTGCPECAKKEQQKRMINRHTSRTNWDNTTFLDRIKTIAPEVEVLDEYINTSSKIRCRCVRCNTEWTPVTGNLLQGKSHCPNCSKKSASTRMKMTQSEFVKRVNEVNPDIDIIGEFKNTKSRIKCKCTKCGNIWSPIADSLLSGRKCRKCAYKEVTKKNTMAHEDFIAKMHAINPNIIIEGEYSGAYKKIKCKCTVCKYGWDAVPHNLLTGRGCPECAHSSTSYIEQFILHALRMVLGKNKVLSRDKSAIKKELDIYIPSMKVAIEPGSWELHKGKYDRDIEKQHKCLDKGISLIIIYYDYTGIPPESDNIICFERDLSQPKEQKTLVDLVYLLLDIMKVQYAFTTDDIYNISSLAYFNSRRVTTDQFRERLRAINPSIKMLGEYKHSRSKVLCKCEICGNEWMVTPNDLAWGKGCPICGKKRAALSRQHTNEEFLQLLSTKNPDIEPLGKR